ncbi:YjjG family noncanonical pyrimidine nucleotidase [Aquimarina gracilis]|uniref:YjjG family noncanonical pyrimidine nucleotidase n=1 Tax=Aquimarina gracilis TaxID=874422 RepID=A0ABU5ZS53_9FLAO|nr:YjjG family noncanonical pyrimidine nucleotidase [Aquimarina gracilis]MEB3344900.1 YjjG family noncanonical pyrimidine nucleotidase [Aquimarina gracilis]
MNNTIEHIFFDLDHTLWDFDKNSSLAFEMIFKKFSIGMDQEAFLKVYRPINMKYWKLYREEKVNKQELRRGRLTETFDILGHSFSLTIIDEMAHDYIAFLPLNNHLINGAKELLDYLNPKYDLHIITNGFKEVQNNKLSNSGIRHYFKTITNSEEVGVKKPNPFIFEHAIKVSGAQNNNSLMIGDNYEADILGAEALGIKTICFNYHEEILPKSSLQVSALKQVKKYL